MSFVPFDIETINWDQFITLQDGGQRYFVGQRYMRGYGVLGTIGKFLLPIAKNLASTMGSEGVEAGQKILKDVTEGRDFSEAVKEHSKRGLENLTEKLKQCGKGKPQRGRGRTNTLGYNSRIYKAKPSLYIPRPGGRKRKPDQLDMF